MEWRHDLAEVSGALQMRKSGAAAQSERASIPANAICGEEALSARSRA